MPYNLVAGSCLLLAAKFNSDLKKDAIKQLIDVSIEPENLAILKYWHQLSIFTTKLVNFSWNIIYFDSKFLVDLSGLIFLTKHDY